MLCEEGVIDPVLQKRKQIPRGEVANLYRSQRARTQTQACLTPKLPLQETLVRGNQLTVREKKLPNTSQKGDRHSWVSMGDLGAGWTIDLVPPVLFPLFE